MIIVRGAPSRVMLVEVDGAGSAIQEGAVLMPGVTNTDSGAKNISVAILATSAGADAIGLLAEAKDAGAAGDPDPDAGTVFEAAQYPVIPFLPGCEVGAQLVNDASNDIDVASATSTVITVTSLEDDIDGSWIYVRAGTGVGQLFYASASASGTITVKSAATTTLDSSSKLIVLRRKFHQLVELDSTATGIKTTAAAGNLPWRVLRNEMQRSGDEGWLQLDPTKHHNLQSLDTNGVKFRQILSPANTLLNPID